MNLAAEARVLALRSERCTDFATTHQPAPVSHLVAKVCDNCFNDHVPEDCIWDGYVSDCSLSSASLASILDTEDGEASIISISEAEDGEPIGETLAPTLIAEDSEPPQAIALEQVLMMAPSGPTDNRSSAPSTAPTNANASGAAATPVVPPAPAPPASEPVIIAPLAPAASTLLGRNPTGFTALGTGPPGFMTPGASTLSLSRTTMTPPIITDEALRVLSMPILGDDPTVRTMEALRLATVAAQI